jgi:ABC-type Zn uptake system ZnuABC Zn-binding protein ZnuA
VKHSKSLSILALTAATALALTGCSSPADSGGDGGDRLRVVAKTTQLADFASEVGGDDIELTGLLPVGGSAHHFDPTPADLLALGQADVLIVNGAGLETFIDSAVEASGFDGAIVEASQGVDLELAREITAEAGGDGADDHDHDHEAEAEAGDAAQADDQADHDHAADDHAHEEEAGEDDHDHGDLNPHLWTSVRFAQGMVHEIAHGLSDADPQHAAAYEERAEAYEAKLAALDEWIAAQYERVPAEQRVLVSGHDSLRYYLHDYDIEFAGSILPSFEDNAEPSAAQIEALVAAIRERGVRAIFVESSMSPKLAQTIADESGAAVVDAEVLYADSLGPAGSGAETYLGATERNTTTILEAWGFTLDPLPSALS